MHSTIQDHQAAGFGQRDPIAADDSIMVDKTSSKHGSPEPFAMDASTIGAQQTSRTAGGSRPGMRIRHRDRRGVYQSIDVSKKQRSPSQQEEYELRKAEERLRTIEMISKYREDKIKAEFRKLESDLKAQDMKNALERQRAKEKRSYHERQKKRAMEQAGHRLHNLSVDRGAGQSYAT